MIRQYKLKDYNFRLVLVLMVLTFIGVLLVGSAEPSLQKKQFAGMILGLTVMVIVSLMDYSWILNFNWIMYGGILILLLLVIFLGTDANGATRWINIGGFQFQPTELCKIVLILFFAKFFMDHEEDLNTLKTLAKSAVLMAVPLALIQKQPD